FANLLEDTFSVTLVIQITIVIIALSISLIQMTVKLDNTIEAIRNAAFVGGQLVHIFCFSLYNCPWYKIFVKSQRLLLHAMRRSLQSNSLSAGGIYIFVLQTSMSYFTVLASFQ
ncbi:Odorant receptor 393, partial [Nylanderia fulva]